MQDIKISGLGDLPGGTFGTVSVAGVGKTTGPISAEKMTVSGAFKGADDISAQKVSVSGTFHCAGSLTIGELSCSGMLDTSKNVAADAVKVSGMLHVHGNQLEAGCIDCTGTITADGQISADKLHSTGLVRAKELVGDEIIIRRPKFSGIFLFHLWGTSKVGLVEATTLVLEGVTASTVNGSDITIGPGCTIDHLDCNGTLSVDSSSTVREIVGDFQWRT